MIVPLVKIIENLVAGDKEKAIAYAEHMVKNTERNHRLFGGVTYHTDMMTARNVLHTLKGEPKEGGVAVCDKMEGVNHEDK